MLRRWSRQITDGVYSVCFWTRDGTERRYKNLCPTAQLFQQVVRPEKDRWESSPLLQEYFYDDYEKISLVLGGQFVKEKNVPNSLKDKGLGKVYEINLPENITPDDFICIYNEDVNNGSNEGTDE